jgi:hypothetical protein
MQSKDMEATVKFVLLPFESHGYAAKENILHLLYEQYAVGGKVCKECDKNAPGWR